MTELPDNILHLPQYQVLGCKSTDDEMHFQVDVPDPIACEECGVQGEFVRFGKRDVPYRDLPIHGKRVTLWVVRRRYTCRACKTTFRPQLPEMVDGFRMTLRLHEYVEKESFNHPYTFVAAQTGLDEKTVRDIFNARAEFLGRWHRFETPRILGIDELYLNKRYRCILTNIEERTLLDLLATRRQDVVTNYLMKLKDRQKVEIVSMDMWNPYRAVGNWREETMTYFETDMPVTNAYTESINRLAKDKNREGRGYSFEVMRARMLYTTKHKKKAPTAKVSPFYKKTIGYGLPDFAEELNYGVDLSTI
ncbi:ISL3 family transposase [Marinobacter excellens]|uniref:Transposase n=1 Tax=Marinobacter excellens LAMA 842 TaxID=1306954 RepID=A0A137S6U7_9GAMM|nr:ISL3 family transposase [Marinobacter excellens]KXO08145.1 Transposase [Marinobacter excellens LAMA 842]